MFSIVKKENCYVCYYINSFDGGLNEWAADSYDVWLYILSNDASSRSQLKGLEN